MQDSPINSLTLAVETADVTKREVETGRVRVSTHTDLSDETLHEFVDSTSVEVTRVTIGRVVDRVPPIRTEDGVTIVSVVEEILVVEKRLVLKEEIHLRTRTTKEAVVVPVTLRRQRAVVERIDTSANPLPTQDETP